MKDCFEMPPHLTGGYPHPQRQFPMMNIAVPPPQQWQFSQMYQSKTPSPPVRRDSGVNVSSPSSDEAENYSTPTMMLHSPNSRYAYQNAYQNSNNLNNARYSPPSMAPQVIDEPNAPEDEREASTGSPQNTDFSNDTNALKNLEASVEKTLNISSSSPEPDDRSPDNNNEDYANMEEYGVPTVNSHGKVKTVKCKQCQIVFKTKLEFWTHQRTHIKPDKLLECKKCPFVTEYKHHLEYHLRNHGGEKPFQCQECDYKCVNKSMLNSHMKSHSNVYQYRCATCHYSSKYCHSLKLHLRKYNHQPAMVLNPDGTPNPLPIIDVYGTRRGPKVKSLNGEDEIQLPSPKRPRTESAPPAIPNIPAILQGIQGMMPLSLMSNDPMRYNLMMHQAMLMQTLQNIQMFQTQNPVVMNSPSSSPVGSADDSALDLSKDKGGSSDDSDKIDHKLDTPSTTDDDEDFETMSLLYKVKVEHYLDDTPAEVTLTTTTPAPNSPQPTSTEEGLRCPHCCITFDDIALFTIHMRFHNFSDPFTCNSCGHKCENKLEFTVHIFSRPH